MVLPIIGTTYYLIGSQPESKYTNYQCQKINEFTVTLTLQ